jgi:cytochrome c oxidase subunit 2
MREAWRRLARYGWPLGLLLAALVLSGCGASNMAPGGTPQGREIHRLWNILLIAGGIIFVAVEALIVWTIVRYRRRDDELPKQTHGNNLLEIVWTVVPLIIVGGLFAVSYGGIGMVNREVPQPDRTIEVVGFQWQWNFTYLGEQLPVKAGQAPDVLTVEGTIANPPKLVLPLGERVRFNLRSADVIHSFFVPGWNFKRDVVPYPRQVEAQAAEEDGGTPSASPEQESGQGAAEAGQSPDEEGTEKFNSFEVTVDRLGTFPGQCAEYCGLSHAAMHFTVEVVTQEKFNAWLAEAKKQAVSGCPDDPNPLAIQAQNTAFNKKCLSAPADKAFQIVFDDKDPASNPHNVAIFKGDDATAPNVFRGATVGAQVVNYDVPALDPGDYFFHCDVHPQAMKGKLVVQ